MRRFFASGRGSFVAFAALGLGVVVTASMATVDAGRLARKHNDLQSALDAASIAGARHIPKGQEAAETAARDVLRSNAPGGVTIESSEFLIESGNILTGAASARVVTPFLSMVGLDSVAVSVDNAAELLGTGAGIETTPPTPDDADILLALDFSSSMGVASTEAGRQVLNDQTLAVLPAHFTHGCAYGCHVREGWEPNGESLRQLARRNGVILREDVMRESVANFIEELLGDGTGPRVGLVGFGGLAELIHEPTSDGDALIEALEAYDATQESTIYDEAMRDLAGILREGREGRENPPPETVIMLTDGVHSVRHEERRLMAPADCDAVKDMDATLAIVHLNYPEQTGNPWFEYYVRPFYADIGPRLEECATDGNYHFSVDDAALPDVLETLIEPGAEVATVRLLR